MDKYNNSYRWIKNDKFLRKNGQKTMIFSSSSMNCSAYPNQLQMTCMDNPYYLMDFHVFDWGVTVAFMVYSDIDILAAYLWFFLFYVLQANNWSIKKYQNIATQIMSWIMRSAYFERSPGWRKIVTSAKTILTIKMNLSSGATSKGLWWQTMGMLQRDSEDTN